MGEAALDLDGNGVSDLWERMNPALAVDADADGDGVSDGDEAVAGTDPLDAASRFAVDRVDFDAGSDEVVIHWTAAAGRHYRIEAWNAVSDSWSEIADLGGFPAGPRSHALPTQGAGMILRLGVEEVDADGDGLSATEEQLLGLDDGALVSGPVAGRTDFAHALRLLEGSGTLSLPGGGEVSKGFPSEEEAARFLVQASFGPDPAMIEEVASGGIGAWLDEQFALPATRTHQVMATSGQPFDAFMWRKAWWRSIMLGEDQLRQRMAFALSQILVVNCDTGSYPGDNPAIQSRHYDKLGTGAFGAYRDVLEDITYSPVMGSYLSHLRNRKSDPSTGRYPDENFAREIMQLFTVGLWELNPDGSRVVDGGGDFVPTYDNEVITEMAKVFTGFSFSTMNRGQEPTTNFFQGGQGEDYYHPMKVWDTEHEPGAKVIIGGAVIPEGQTAEEDVQMTLDVLCAHPSMAPFLSRLLIQRFTASNPSPGYIERVATIWQDDGSGQSGNLRAVIEAILLDPEARIPGGPDDTGGKLREPLLRFTALLRAFEARNAAGTFPYSSPSSYMIGRFGQFPMLAPSVFNFYSPDHQPAGEMRQRDLVSPELELATASRMILEDNEFRQAIDNTWGSLSLELDEFVALAGDTAALLDKLGLLLAWGSLSDETRATIADAIDGIVDPVAKTKAAIHLIVESPECVVIQ